jgi:hypothetical protein
MLLTPYTLSPLLCWLLAVALLAFDGENTRLFLHDMMPQIPSEQNHFLPLFGVRTLACEYLIFTHKNQVFTLLPSRQKGLTSYTRVKLFPPKDPWMAASS